MANLEVLRGFIAQALSGVEDIGGPVERDEDGDFRLRRGSAQYWVAAAQTAGGAGIVQVGSVVLRDVPLSKKALKAVNSVNAECVWIRASWVDDVILIARDIPADIVTAAVLLEACDFIGAVADEKDDEFKELLAAGTSAYDDDGRDDDAVEV